MPDRTKRKVAAVPVITGEKLENSGADDCLAVSRSRLRQRFVDDLYTSWTEENASGESLGIRALRTFAEEQPAAFVQLAVAIVRREFDLGDGVQSTFRAVREALASMRLQNTQGDKGRTEKMSERLH